MDSFVGARVLDRAGLNATPGAEAQCGGRHDALGNTSTIESPVFEKSGFLCSRRLTRVACTIYFRSNISSALCSLYQLDSQVAHLLCIRTDRQPTAAMTAGLVRVWLEPHDSVDEATFQKWRETAFLQIPGVSNVDYLTATDNEDSSNHYRYENAYTIDDAHAIDEALVNHLRASAEGVIKRSDWQIYERISYDKRDDAGERLPGTVFVTVGMSPIETPENLADYHEWYKQEHMPILSDVPGWRTGSRYRLVVCYGDHAEFCSPYLAVHQYNEKNGLGGEQWLKSVNSEWTKRVMSNLAAPNHRRVWRLEA